jgi:hypothetical protein
MSDDLDSLLARLDARTQAFTGHHIDLEREAAAAIRELRDEPLGQRGDYWRDRAQEMERDLDAARIDLRKVNEYNGNLAQELHDARAEVERLKDPDGDHHYMKRLLAQERERARIAELCECGEPECIKQQVTEQRLRAERAEAEVERLRAPKWACHCLAAQAWDIPGVHCTCEDAPDDAEERAERAEALVRELAGALDGWRGWACYWCSESIVHHDDVCCTKVARAALVRAREEGWLP